MLESSEVFAAFLAVPISCPYLVNGKLLILKHVRFLVRYLNRITPKMQERNVPASRAQVMLVYNTGLNYLFSSYNTESDNEYWCRGFAFCTT